MRRLAPAFALALALALAIAGCGGGGADDDGLKAQQLDRLAARYISVWIERGSPGGRGSGTNTYAVDNGAGTWSLTGRSTSVVGNYNDTGGYSMDVNGDGSFGSNGGSPYPIYAAANGSAIVGAEVSIGSLQYIEVFVKATGTAFAANDPGLNGVTFHYAFFSTTAAAASAASIGTITLTGTGTATGTWVGTQAVGAGIAAGTFTGGGTFAVAADGGFEIVIGGRTYAGGIQDGHGMLIAAAIAGDPGLLVLCDRAIGLDATVFDGRTFHGVFFEDGGLGTTAGVTTDTFTASSVSTGTITQFARGTVNGGGSSSPATSGPDALQVSGFGSDGTFQSNDAAAPPLERFRHAVNGTGTRGIWIDAEEVSGSLPEIGIVIGG